MSYQTHCMCCAPAANIHFAFNRATRLFCSFDDEDPSSPYTWYALHRDDQVNMCKFLSHYHSADLTYKDFSFLESRWVSMFVDNAPKPQAVSRRSGLEKRAFQHIINKFMAIDLSDNEIEMTSLQSPQIIPDVGEVVESTPSCVTQPAFACVTTMPITVCCDAIDLLDCIKGSEVHGAPMPTASNYEVTPLDCAPNDKPVSYDSSVLDYLKKVLRHSDVYFDSRRGNYHRWYGIENTTRCFNFAYVVDDIRLCKYGRRLFLCSNDDEELNSPVFASAVKIFSANPIHKVLSEKRFLDIYRKLDSKELICFLRSITNYGASVEPP